MRSLRHSIYAFIQYLSLLSCVDPSSYFISDIEELKNDCKRCEVT